MSSRLPLDLIEVQSPCPKDWNRMSGSDQKRYCDHCNRHVHDLSAMTESEAQELICRAAGHLCVRFTRLANGKIKTLDYFNPPGRRGYGWRVWTMVGVIGAAIAACIARFKDPPVSPPGVVVGEMSMPINAPPGTTPNPPPCQTP
jgi:hypothetical protein